MLRAYKYRLYPTDEQKVLFAKTFGCCRFVYNWGLSIQKSEYESKKKKLSKFDLMKKMRSELKSESGRFSEI
jgi:putative transposase